MARSGHGEGSVFQRKDGRWVATIRLDGTRHYRYAHTKREARQALREVIREHTAGTLSAPTRETLATWVVAWMDRAAPHVRPSTMRGYRQTTAPILATQGSTPLHQLTPKQLADTFTHLRAEGHGARRLQMGYGYVKAALREAVDLGVLNANPMDRVPRPRFTPQGRRYWTVEETSRFVAHCLAEQARWAPFFAILATCGLRLSEALGLTWRDVDLKAGTVRIERALVWVGTQPHLGPVKTKAARRVVTLPTPAVEAFAKIPRPIDPDMPVFLTSRGTSPDPSRLRQRLATLCQRADVPRIHVHGLRHVAATMALKVSRDPHVVKERMGHSDVAITVQLYGYAATDDGEVADRLSTLLKASAPVKAQA